MALITTGFLSGIIGGMGIGGGTILIPIMTIFLGFDQKTAQAVNLIYFIPTAITALTIHVKNRQIVAFNSFWYNRHNNRHIMCFKTRRYYT